MEKLGKRFAKTEGKTVVREKMVQKKIAKAPPRVKGKTVLSTTPTAAKSTDKDKKKKA
ncbi:MAG: hypothetical protein JO102_01720 [Elusimicrobia bacterium]|nr:hypothetical protein [Elusimicrobiota bacterium]